MCKCLDRLLVSWTALKDFFKAEKSQMSRSSSSSSREMTNAERKVDKILAFLRSPSSRLYCLFLQYTHKVYASVLVTMQAEEPKIHLLRRSLHILIRNILVRFVKPSALYSKTVDSVQYNVEYNQKAGKDLLIGEEATSFILKKEESGLKDSKIQFYCHVKMYFITAVNYLKEKLPLDDPVLRHSEVADDKLRTSSQVSSLAYLLDRFPILLPPQSSRNTVLEEFSQFQATDIPGSDDERVDDAWTRISNELGQPMFANLSTVMKGVLTITHSSPVLTVSVCSHV